MDIRQQIIDRLNSIDNPAILNEILDLISAESETDEIYRLSKAERRNVNKGIEDADSGNTMNQEESEKLISEWLKERSSGP